MTRLFSRALGPSNPRLRLRLGMAFGGLCVLAVSIVARYYWGADPAGAAPPARLPARTNASRVATAPTAPQATTTTQAKPQAAISSPGSSPTQLKVVAVVNGEQIGREQLAEECLKHYGKAVLERLVNKYLIMQECKRQNIAVSQDEVNEEIKQMASRFGLPVEEWLKMLKQERGISPTQYAADIIWPTLALRKLAGEQLEVSQEELAKMFESQYGAAVKVRMIVCAEKSSAEKILAAVAANPASFPELARKHSKDVPSASADGLIQPIRKYAGPKEIEDVVFALKEGEISSAIKVADQYVILKCEGHLPAMNVQFEKVKPAMITMLRDNKMRHVASEIFRKLQQTAQVVNVMNDPAKSQQMPGVAATINGNPIQVRELAELCVQRHGEEVLEGTINRRLLEQACKRQNLTIGEADLDQEILRAASAMLPAKDGKPDIEKWMSMATEEQGISVEVYRNDSVWPSVALKKLVGANVQISEDDLKKGFEANFGPRVRCRAVVLNNLRRAQQVWDMARSNPTEEYFGDLAQQYSIEASSASLRGEVPPIQKHGGQPVLEKEAFALKKGELSSIIQVGPERYVIMLCEGQTEPVKVEFASVRSDIYADIHEKKLRLAMADYFQQLQDNATIDNYLAGTSQSPKKAAEKTTDQASLRAGSGPATR
jgi:parvulin-like peptidyl-prolyl isomerase